MLEEALQDEKHDPSETAVAVLDFLNSLAIGGAAAEARFCKSLFVPLCDRVFGPLLPGPDGSFRHKDSAWLATTKRWRLPQPTRGDGSPSSHARITSPTNAMKQPWNQDPVVKLLDINLAVGMSPGTSQSPRQRGDAAAASPTTPVSLLAAMSSESENRPSVGYPFPFLALSKSTQQAWTMTADWEKMAAMQNQMQHAIPAHFPEQPFISDNHKKLFLELLRFKPSEQQHLTAYRQKLAEDQYGSGGAASASPFRLSTPSFASPARQPFFASPMPTRFNPQNTPHQDNKEAAAAFLSTPMLRLGMLEYYLLAFLHFAMAPPPSMAAAFGLDTSMMMSTAMRASPLKTFRRPAPFGQAVYNYLFRQYCKCFLPVGHFSGRDSELFLRLVIALWLESQLGLRTTMAVVTAWQERQQRRLGRVADGGSKLPEPSFDLDASYDLVVLETNASSVSTLVKDGLGFLVQHLLSHSQVLSLVQNYRATSRSTTAESPNKTTTSSNNWCLTEAMTAIQLPLYNYLRATLRTSPVHTPTSSFFSALDTWLNWLEPWNFVTIRNLNNRVGGGGDPDTPGGGKPLQQQGQLLSRIALHRAGQRKPFEQRLWAPYVAANLSLYTVPLAIFLRRARELDFSANKFHESCQIVSRVFAVFSPELIDTIKLLLRGDSRYAALVDVHFQSLGPYAPPNRNMALSSCQSDMRLLLEEMHMHHSKMLDNMDAIDWFSAKVGALFGQGGTVSGEDKVLLQLVERAKLLVDLPDGYQVFAGRERSAAGENTGSSDDQEKRKPARTTEGTLTVEGREQLLRGEALCSPLDVRSESDPMTRTVLGTYEIGWLVSLFVAVSVWMNERLGLPKSQINLRFLGDYRNLAFSLMFGYLVLKMVVAFLRH